MNVQEPLPNRSIKQQQEVDSYMYLHNSFRKIYQVNNITVSGIQQFVIFHQYWKFGVMVKYGAPNFTFCTIFWAIVIDKLVLWIRQSDLDPFLSVYHFLTDKTF